MAAQKLNRWRTCFLTGLAVVLPAVISIAIVVWLFGTVSNITDTLLFFLPRNLTHQGEGTGPIHWYWSVVALLVAVALITLVGRLTRFYVGRKAIAIADGFLLSIPLLNKVYSTMKQVNDAFSANRKSSFRQVVLVEFPSAGLYSIGFLTSEENQEVEARIAKKIVNVFVPTTPNPTTGFLVMVPEEKVTRLDMPVADGIKLIISLGSVSPEYGPGSARRESLPSADA